MMEGRMTDAVAVFYAYDTLKELLERGGDEKTN